MEEEILDARKNPELSQALAKKYMADGLAVIDKKLPNSDIELDETIAYKVLHFGAGGAAKIVKALEETPKRSFESVVGKDVCKNNHAICYNKRTRKPLSVTQVYAMLEKRLEKAPDITVTAGQMAPN